MKSSRFIPHLLLAFAFLSEGAFATSQRPPDEPPGQIPTELQNIGIDAQLGKKLNLESHFFRDEAGNKVGLASFFHQKKPVILNLVYYQCPSLCNLLLNGLLEGLKKLSWTVGEQFDIVTLSINPRETPELARAKKENYLKMYGRPDAAKGWHFLTGDEASIQSLAAELGFKYRYDEKQKEYAHAAGIWLATSEGLISRVLYGIQFLETDLRLALLEAGHGDIGTIVDRVLLFCYRYDPKEKKYSLGILRLIQAGSGVMLLVLGIYLLLFWRRQGRESEP